MRGAGAKRREVSVFPQFLICSKCGAVADTVVVEVRPGGAIVLKCPRCGSRRVSSAYA